MSWIIIVGILIIGFILINIFIGFVKGIYKMGYKKGDYDGFRRYHDNQICIDCKVNHNVCGNPNGYNGTGYCKWED